MQEFPLLTLIKISYLSYKKDAVLTCTCTCAVFWFSGVYNEATNEIVTGGVGNVTVSTHLRQCYNFSSTNV